MKHFKEGHARRSIRLRTKILLVCMSLVILCATLWAVLEKGVEAQIEEIYYNKTHALLRSECARLLMQVDEISNALASLGMNRIPWLSENKWWIVMYVLVSVWQSIGYGAIIYMSAMSSIDQEIYEAARVDGCSRFKMMYLITLPSIKTTIVIMLILKIGGMMSIGFEQPQMLKNAMVNDVGDVISTFIYRYGIQNAKHSLSTAAGLLQSVINFVLVMSANAVSRKISDESIW